MFATDSDVKENRAAQSWGETYSKILHDSIFSDLKVPKWHRRTNGGDKNFEQNRDGQTDGDENYTDRMHRSITTAQVHKKENKYENKYFLLLKLIRIYSPQRLSPRCLYFRREKSWRIAAVILIMWILTHSHLELIVEKNQWILFLR